VFQIFVTGIDPRALQHPIVELYFLISRDRTAFEEVLIPSRVFPLIVDEMHKRCTTAHTDTMALGWNFFSSLASVSTTAVRQMLEKYVLHSAARVLISGGASEGHSSQVVTECCRTLYHALETLHTHGELKTAIPIMLQKGVDFVTAFGKQLVIHLDQQCDPSRAGACIRGLVLYFRAIPPEESHKTRQLLLQLPDLTDAVTQFYHASEATLSIPASELLDSLNVYDMDMDDDDYDLKHAGGEYKF
jgi:hypothetical protein